MTNNKIDPKAITIEHIRIIHSDVTSTEQYRDNPQKLSKIEIQNKQNSAFNFQEKRMRIRLNTLLQGVDQNLEKLGVSGEFLIEFHTYVDNFDDFVIEESEEKKISGTLMSTLISIVYSTARGIIFEKLQGTYLSGCILPVINPDDLIEKQSSK